MLRAAFQVLFLDLGLACISLGLYSASIFPWWCGPTHTFTGPHTGEAHSRCPLTTAVLESELEQHNDQGQN